jgi:UDP-N-acetylmuramoyl-tripeptide--D-alanyl-D-alanine ligase
VAELRIDQLAAVVGGNLLSGDGTAVASGAAIDSRAVRGGEIFFALPGAQTDGHRFVADACARGATVALVEQDIPLPSQGAVIRVENTFQALHDLARFVRERGVPQNLLGITGSVGKTTTKELLAALLPTRFRTAWSPGNLNNLFGFPLSLLNVPEGTEWMVAEMGMSTAGELRQLSLLGRPNVALFTLVRPVHLEFFAGVREIAEAKAEILAGLAPSGWIVANADDPEVARIASRHVAQQGGRVVWYGRQGTYHPLDVQLTDLRPAPDGEVGSRFVLEAAGERAAVTLPLHGLYNAENCLAAATCAWALGLSLEEIAAAVGAVRPAAHRGVVHRLPKGVTVIDDSYNSNPDALVRALEGAALLPAARRWAVLGDMRELGPEGPRFHRECGRRAADLGFSPVVGVGELARELAGGAKKGGAATEWFADAAAAADWAARALQPGDLVLVKGSRGVGLEAVVASLVPAAVGGGGH